VKRLIAKWTKDNAVVETIVGRSSLIGKDDVLASGSFHWAGNR